MRVVVQRSKESSVSVDGKLVSKIENGLVLLVSFTEEDSFDDIDYMVRKIIHMRIFADETGIMNKSILEVNGCILSISQFTLYADTKKGNRPSYKKAMKGDFAIKFYERFNEKLNEHIKTVTGIFGANMEVCILNDGPVTILLDSKEK